MSSLDGNVSEAADLRYASSDKRRPQGEETSSIDAILHSLQRRPNVLATIILSRKDGSIIRASGPKFDQENRDLRLKKSYNESDVKEAAYMSESATGTQPDVDSPAPIQPSGLQVLACSIFAFVASSVALGGALQEENAITASEVQARKTQSGRNSSDGHSEDEIQLLRLRLRRQEIIIYPDPSYLCCVVQGLEKAGK